jgi:hypothetical protein
MSHIGLRRRHPRPELNPVQSFQLTLKRGSGTKQNGPVGRSNPYFRGQRVLGFLCSVMSNHNQRTACTRHIIVLHKHHTAVQRATSMERKSGDNDAWAAQWVMVRCGKARWGKEPPILRLAWPSIVSSTLHHLPEGAMYRLGRSRDSSPKPINNGHNAT